MYFDSPYGLVKIRTTRKNTQRYYKTKRLIKYIYFEVKKYNKYYPNYYDIIILSPALIRFNGEINSDIKFRLVRNFVRD